MATLPDVNAQHRFEILVKRWKQERRATSLVHEMCTTPSYQMIIGMGPVAVPLILQELAKQPDHWTWALMAITGEDPVDPEHYGDVEAMAMDWLAWGRHSQTARLL
ncbi:MAG: hypothetical protein WD873_03525 [Candidatus Hydrogenedentales bacterium]